MRLSLDELTLMMVYNPGTRAELIEELGKMRGKLEDDEWALRRLVDTVVAKLEVMTDAEFDTLPLYPNMD